MNSENKLPLNTLSFIALCNEYCAAIENASQTEKDDFINSMLRILPRLYITISDVAPDYESAFVESAYLNPILEEDYYDSVRRSMEMLLGEDDNYLDVFEEDMKYSDTPIGASISEGLADIFQVLYNFVENVKDSTNAHILLFTYLVKEEFENFWSKTLCNTFRAINALKYNKY